MLLLAALFLGATPSPATVSETDLRSGGVAWVEVSIPLTRPPSPPLWALVIGAEAGPARVLPFAEVTRVGRRAARVRIPVHLAPGARQGMARATVVVTPVKAGRALGRLRMTRTLRGEARTRESTTSLLQQHREWTSLAEAIRRRNPDLSRLSLDAEARMAVPELDAVQDALDFGRARVEVFAAEAALRSLLLSAQDAEGRREAWAALAKLDHDALPPPRDTVARSLKRITADLSIGRVSRARARAQSLRQAGTANRAELARLLAIEGLLADARGLRSAADVALGQALCLEPGLTLDLRLPTFTEPLDRIRARQQPCPEGPLKVATVRAERRIVRGEAALAVHGQVKGDPFQLVAEARVERFGPGGGLAQTLSIPVAEDRSLEAVFTGGKDALHAPSQVGVRVTLVDRTGVVVDRWGAPDPELVPLENGEGVGGLPIPVWLGIVAGAVVVVGAASAGAVAATNQSEVRRGLGPFRVDF